MVEFPFEFTRTFPELDRIGIIGREENSKNAEDSGGVNLERMRTQVEDFLSHMDGIRDSYDLGNIVQRTCLIDTISYSEKFSLRASDERGVMNGLDKRAIYRVDMSDGSGNVVFDAHVGYNQSSVQDRRVAKNHFIKFLGAAVVFFFFCFIN